MARWASKLLAYLSSVRMQEREDLFDLDQDFLKWIGLDQSFISPASGSTEKKPMVDICQRKRMTQLHLFGSFRIDVRSIGSSLAQA